MLKWQYLRTHNLTEFQLNLYGTEGWELVSTSTIGDVIFYFFKRPMQS